MSHKSRGFTLTELLVAIAVCGILAVVAAPAYKGWINKAQYKEAARELVSVLREARARAIEQNLNYRVELDMRGISSADPPGYRLIKWDTGTGTWSTTPEESGRFPKIGLLAGADTNNDGFSNDACGDVDTTQFLVFVSNGSVKINQSSEVTRDGTKYPVQFFCVQDEGGETQARGGVASVVTGRVLIE